MSSYPRRERKRSNSQSLNRDVFEPFFVEHYKFVKAKAVISCHNEVIAEQLTLDAFARAARAFHRFDHQYPQAWLKRILRNVVIDYYNKQKRERAVFATTDFEVVERTHQDEESPQINVDDYELLEKAIRPELEISVESHSEEQIKKWSEKYLSDEMKEGLESLSADHRNIIIAREILGYNYIDIGVIFEIKEGTVMSRLSRARVALRKEINEIRSRM
jgi:RNA polymerase sigma factor (sigma-70 family)